MPRKQLDFERDATSTPGDAVLAAVRTLAERQLMLENSLAEIDDQRAEVAEELRRVREVDLPLAMEEVGLESFSLTTGEKVEIKKTIKASIPASERDRAFAWLRDNGHGSLIKNEAVASFGRGEDKKAQQLVKFCTTNSIEVNRKESVHPQTLSAFVREQLEAGTRIPMETLGVIQLQEAKIKRRK